MIGPFKDEYRWLSNFWDSPIRIAGQTYKTNEHFYQASKTLHIDKALEIVNAETPGQAKRMGSQLTLRSDWDFIRTSVMTLATFSKFTQNEDLAYKLIETGHENIVEINYWHDNFWGSCHCDSCNEDPTARQNNLGKTIEEVRKYLIEEWLPKQSKKLF